MKPTCTYWACDNTNEVEYKCSPSDIHNGKQEKGKEIIYRCVEHCKDCCQQIDWFEERVKEALNNGITEAS